MEGFAHLLLRAENHYQCPVLLWHLKQRWIEETDFHITLAFGSGYCWRETKTERAWTAQFHFNGLLVPFSEALLIA